MTNKLKSVLVVLIWCVAAMEVFARASGELQDQVRKQVDIEYPTLFEFYKDLHTHPELSFQEEQTSARVAAECRKAGFEVTTGVGKHGVVAVLRNGGGPTVLLRTDMDALPVKEQTGLPYASTATTLDDKGDQVPVMHACGHDAHMACAAGTARILARLKDRWHGTLVIIVQPAAERGGRARVTVADRLFARCLRAAFWPPRHDPVA